MKLRYLLFSLALFYSSFSLADMTGAGDMKIILELQQIYSSMMKTLEEAKTQSESLNKVKSTLNTAMETRDTIQNFSIDRIAKKISKDFDNLTALDDMDGLSNEQKIKVLRRELKRRVADPETSQADADKYNKQLGLLEDVEKRQEVLGLINDNATKNIEKTGTDLSERDSSRIAAESLATLTQIEAQREMRANKERIQKLNDAKVLSDINKQTTKIYEEGF